MSKSKEKPSKKNKSTERPQPVRATSPSVIEEFKPSSSLVNFLKKRNLDLSSGRAEPPVKSDFKLNPTAGIMIDEGALKLSEAPLDSIEQAQPISIMKMKGKERAKQESEDAFRKAKKYHFDLPTIGGMGQARQSVDPMEIEQDDKLVRPSEIYELPSPRAGKHCIFQTPVLPNFQQSKLERTESKDPIQNFFQKEYDSCGNEVTQNYKTLAKEGVYKIGKIKIKGKKAELIIGDVKMEACLGYGEGRAVAVAEDNMYEVGDWSGMWIVQPTAELFQ